MTARTERPVVAYRVAVAAVLAAEAALLLWNAWRYDWLRGYDAFANDQYSRILSTEHRLPSRDRVRQLAHAAALVRPGGRAPPRGDLDGVGAGAEARAAARRRWPGSRLRPRPPPGAGALAGPPDAAPRRPRARLGIAGARSRLGDVPPGDARDRARRRRRARRGPRTAEALDAARRRRGRGAPRPRRRYAAVGASGPRRGGGRRRLRRLATQTLGRGCGAGRDVARAPRAVARQRGGRARERARLQSSSSDGIDPRAAAAELLPRPARPPGLRPSRDPALPQRAAAAALRGLVGRLGADLGQPAAARPGPAPPREGGERAHAADVRRHRPVRARARGSRRAGGAGERAAIRGDSRCFPSPPSRCSPPTSSSRCDTRRSTATRSRGRIS